MPAAGTLVHDEATNSAIGWALIGVVTIAVISTAISGDYLRTVFTTVVAVVAALPALVRANHKVMVPWPLLALTTGAVVTLSFGGRPDIGTPVAVAGLALIGVAELSAFTTVEMSYRFAVGFATLTTLALQGVWIVAQFYADRWLETEYLTTQVELQVDIVIVTVIAVVVGLLFQWYVTRFEPPGSRAYHGGPTE
ncbi:hypothetical protein [Haloarcula nitratireducens]|uniref:Uncharacterized protein n=1 Tax=Haloarcula nitratireducens TaxID=2487749 RepID=A0AAW4PJ11_9EURY|nr:hypothetical protein [Halomicroarcula nitratireducens]MBX0297946.1 hypothetical protein [Halomicroarcula nitratireducens]